MFNEKFKYLNKFFVVGTLIGMSEQFRSDESSFGTQLQLNVASPVGRVFINLPNSKLVPNTFAECKINFSEGSRISAGLGNDWLRFSQREYHNRMYQNFLSYRLPRLATLQEEDRAAGKLIGELVSKEINDDSYDVILRIYDINKDGSVQVYKGEEKVNDFYLVAYGDVANEIHNIPIGSNISCGVRINNEIVYDDFGDISRSSNEVKIEKLDLLSSPKISVPKFTPVTHTVPFSQTTTTNQSSNSNLFKGFNSKS